MWLGFKAFCKPSGCVEGLPYYVYFQEPLTLDLACWLFLLNKDAMVFTASEKYIYSTVLQILHK